MQVGADASTAQDDWGDAGGGGADEFEVDLDHEVRVRAARVPRNACRLSSQMCPSLNSDSLTTLPVRSKRWQQRLKQRRPRRLSLRVHAFQ
jgi:hypothetical protein